MPDQQAVNLWELADLCTPWCVHVVATLHIAEHIAAGKDQINDLASAAGCDAYALHRVLTHLVGKGLFQEPVPGRFTLNEAAEQLLHPSMRLGFDLDDFGGRMAHAWGTLLGYVRTGAPAYHERFGLPFWDDLNANPAIGATFDAIMGPAGHGIPDADFDITDGWESVWSVVDVGGGTGAMLAELLRKWPHLQGTLVDFPRTVALAGEILQTTGVADRVTVVGQSFFDPLPAGADLYLLRKVLSDFPDREAKLLLTRCRDAARPAGRVLILGGVVPDGTARPISIEMVLLGGKRRTVSEFKELADEVGLTILAAERQPFGEFVVECRSGSTADVF